MAPRVPRFYQNARDGAIASRYERDAEGNVVIDVSAGGIEDLYHYYDRSSPHVRRDLDPELADYLIDCARELHGQPFVIQYSLQRPPDQESRSRIANSINVYFLYLAARAQQVIRGMLRKSAVLLLTGLALLSLTVWLSQWLGDARSLAADVFVQGLTVAAWVSLWESLATLLIEWLPQRREVNLFTRIARSRLAFRELPAGI
jgi:hypothetical protein